MKPPTGGASGAGSTGIPAMNETPTSKPTSVCVKLPSGSAEKWIVSPASTTRESAAAPPDPSSKAAGLDEDAVPSPPWTTPLEINVSPA